MNMIETEKYRRMFNKVLAETPIPAHDSVIRPYRTYSNAVIKEFCRRCGLSNQKTFHLVKNTQGTPLKRFSRILEHVG